MFKEDNSVFLQDFGVEAEITLRDGTVVAAKGIFDCAEMDGALGNAKVAATQPRLSLPLEAVSGAARGDAVRLSDANVFPGGEAVFRIAEIIAEGTGWATLALAPKKD